MIATIFAIIICIYPYPEKFDISRFVRYYETFQLTEDFGKSFTKILLSTPDFIAKIVIATLAKTGVPIEVFFFIVTFYTVTMLFLFFEKVYFFINKKKPKLLYYVVFTLLLPSTAIFSGIRNIHAWSIVLLVAFSTYTNQKTSLKSLIYASFFHFSAYLFIPIIYFLDRIKKINAAKLFLSTLLVSLIVKLLTISQVINWSILPVESFSTKLDFYLFKSEFLMGRWQSGSVKGFFFQLGYLYTPFVFLLCLNINKEEFRVIYSNVWFKVGGFLLIFFMFYPDVLNRLVMLTNIVAAVLIFSFWKKKLSYVFKWYFIYILLFEICKNYLFWKSVYFQAIE